MSRMRSFRRHTRRMTRGLALTLAWLLPVSTGCKSVHRFDGDRYRSNPGVVGVGEHVQVGLADGDIVVGEVAQCRQGHLVVKTNPYKLSPLAVERILYIEVERFDTLKSLGAAGLILTGFVALGLLQIWMLTWP